MVGYPRGSVVRYSVRQDMKGLQGMMAFFSLSFAFTILGAVTVLLISGYRYYRRMRGVTEAIGQLASGGSVHLTCGSPVYQRERAAKWRHPCDGPAYCAADCQGSWRGHSRGVGRAWDCNSVLRRRILALFRKATGRPVAFLCCLTPYIGV